MAWLPSCAMPGVPEGLLPKQRSRRPAHIEMQNAQILPVTCHPCLLLPDLPLPLRLRSPPPRAVGEVKSGFATRESYAIAFGSMPTGDTAERQGIWPDRAGRNRLAISPAQ